MARSKTPMRSAHATQTFITELPLVVDSQLDAELLSSFQAARQLYNACLNEAMARMEHVLNSDAYKAAKKISRDNPKERQKAFGECERMRGARCPKTVSLL